MSWGVVWWKAHAGTIPFFSATPAKTVSSGPSTRSRTAAMREAKPRPSDPLQPSRPAQISPANKCELWKGKLAVAVGAHRTRGRDTAARARRWRRRAGRGWWWSVAASAAPSSPRPWSPTPTSSSSIRKPPAWMPPPRSLSRPPCVCGNVSKFLLDGDLMNP